LFSALISLQFDTFYVDYLLDGVFPKVGNILFQTFFVPFFENSRWSPFEKNHLPTMKFSALHRQMAKIALPSFFEKTKFLLQKRRGDFSICSNLGDKISSYQKRKSEGLQRSPRIDLL
jgi:hypothetical protein